MDKSKLTLSIDRRVKEDFKDEVGSGNLSQAIEEFMKRHADSSGDINDRLSSLRSKRHELLSRLEEKQKELDELKDEINRTDQEIQRLEQEKEQQESEFEQAKQKFVSKFSDRFGDKISCPEDLDYPHWKQKLEMDKQELFSLLENEVQTAE